MSPSVLPEAGFRGSLRRHLAVVLMVAALAPLALLALLSAVLVLESVDARMRAEASRGLEVAHSLLLRQVHAVAARAGALAEDRPLLEMLGRGAGAALEERLRSALDQGGAAALIEVANAGGDVLARCGVGGCADGAGSGAQGDLYSPDRSPSILRALAFERTVSIEPTRRLLAVRAAMPLADERLALVGVVVVSLPLDGPFADRLKAALGSQREVIFYRDGQPSASTLISPSGERVVGPPLPPEALSERAAELPVLPVAMGKQALAVAFGRILDADGRNVGMLGVAIDREPLHATRRRAATVLALGVLAALALAILLGRTLGRRLHRALGELHAGMLALTHGDGEVSLPGAKRDELGGLAEAFRTMATTVAARQRHHAECSRELQVLHQLGRELNAIVDADTILERAVAGARDALDASLTAVLLTDLDGGVPRVALQGAVAGADAFTSALRHLGSAGPARTVAAGENDTTLGPALRAAGLTGPLVVAPLALHGRQTGAMLALLRHDVVPGSPGALDRLTTIAGLTAPVLDRARLLGDAGAFAERLEHQVRERTAELARAGAEAERAWRELHEAQVRVADSEVAAGLGALAAQMVQALAGPTAAVRAQAAALSESVRLLQERTGTLLRLSGDGIDRYLAVLARALPVLARTAVPPTAARRELQRQLADRLEGVESAEDAATLMAPLGPQAEALLPAVVDACHGETVLELCAHAAAAVRVARLTHRLERAALWFVRAEQAIQTCVKPAGECEPQPVDVAAALADAIAVMGAEPDGALRLSRPPGELPPAGAVAGEIDLMWAALLQHVLHQAGELAIVAGALVDDGMLVFTFECGGLALPPGAPARLGEAVRGRAEPAMADAGLVLAGRLAARQGGEIELRGDSLHTRFVVRLPLFGAGGET